MISNLPSGTKLSGWQRHCTSLLFGYQNVNQLTITIMVKKPLLKRLIAKPTRKPGKCLHLIKINCQAL